MTNTLWIKPYVLSLPLLGLILVIDLIAIHQLFPTGSIAPTVSLLLVLETIFVAWHVQQRKMQWVCADRVSTNVRYFSWLLMGLTLSSVLVFALQEELSADELQQLFFLKLGFWLIFAGLALIATRLALSMFNLDSSGPEVNTATPPSSSSFGQAGYKP